MNKDIKMIPVCVYRDLTGLFSPSECDEYNLIELDFPSWIVKDYYKYYEDVFKKGMEHELGVKGNFITWYKEYYTAEDTSELIEYAREREFIPSLNSNIKTYVFYLDDNIDEVTVFRGTEDECREFGKSYNWEYDGYELLIEADDLV